MLLSFKILTHLSIRFRLDCLQNFGFQDLNNFESDPEEFARTFCRDQGIEDPEVGVRTAYNYSIYKKKINYCLHVWVSRGCFHTLRGLAVYALKKDPN